LRGDFRFAVPEGRSVERLELGKRGGYLDRFGNEWVAVLSKKGAVAHWRQHLTWTGELRLKKALNKAKAQPEDGVVLVHATDYGTIFKP